ncbi:MAG: hypothetical protein HWN65_10810 [Candidatus Helarchaeota archaeon]|nr:hypothetical protein [Candidatus Helarchaeota archaeon]
MSSKKKMKKACIWNRRGACSEKVIERLTAYEPDEWSKTTPGKALESDYSVQYCNFCLMSKLVDQVEELNENLVKIYKKLRSIP